MSATAGDEVFASLDSFCRAYRVDRRDIIRGVGYLSLHPHTPN